MTAFFLLLRHDTRWVVGGLLMTFFSTVGQTIFISMSGGYVRSEYGLSNGEWGTIYMIGTLCSALTLPYLGVIVDRYRAVQVLLLSAPMLALGAIVMAVSTHVATLLLAVYLLRLFGQGMMTHAAYTYTARWFSAQRGKALSLVVLGHNIGDALFANLFVLVAVAVGWRMGWVAGAGAVVAALPLMAWLVRVERKPRSSEVQARYTDAPDWTRAQVLRDSVFYLAMTGVIAPSLLMTVAVFHQVHLIEIRGWSLEVFASAFIVWGVVNGIFTLISGQLIDRFSCLALLPFVLAPLGCSFLALGMVEAEWAPFAFMALAGVGNGLTTTLFGAVWPEIYGLKHLGAIRSLVVSASVFATAAGPGIAGYLIDAGIWFPYQLIAMGLYCFGACFVMAHVVRRVRARLALPSL